MMLVASLFVSGSYDRIAGYAPGSQVTDHNAIDLDQAVMETHLKAGDFAKALNVYDNGGNSKSYAELTIAAPGTAKNITKGALMEATRLVADNELGEPTKAIGKAYDNYPAGSTKIRFQYKTSDTQWKADGTTPGYNQDCRVGGMDSGDAYYSTDGCVDGAKTVKVTFVDGTTEDIDVTVAHKNGRTIKGFSTGAQGKMFDDCKGCPYDDYVKYYEYYGSHTYADDWVRAALTGGDAGFTKGNIDFTKAIKSYDGTAVTDGAVGDAQALKMRVQTAKKGAAYMNTWMYVIREFEDAVDDCKKSCIACNDDPVHAWDEGVAFWTGSLEKEDGFSSGKQIYALAEKRCKDFKTCGKDSGMNSLQTEGSDDQDVTAKVNYDLNYHFANGEFLLAYGRCAEVRPVVRKVVALMTVPLIQGTLKYVYKKFAAPMDAKFADVQSEGATFAAAVLPMVAACSATDAATIAEHASLHSTTWVGKERPAYDTWNQVKTAFENNYACLGITCADIGGLYGDLAEGQPGHDGRRLSEKSMGYFEGAEPCSDSVTLTAGEYDQIAGYEPGSQVTDHAAIDQDQSAMESFLGKATPDFAAAKKIYKSGGFSKSYALLTVPALPRAIKKGSPMYATSISGGAVAGKSYDNYDAGVTEIKFQYKTGDSQDTYSNCKAGGLLGTDYAHTDGCVDATKTVLVTFDSDGDRTVLADVGATGGANIEHKNGRTLAGFSTGAGKKMRTSCVGCPYEDFMKFYNYYGVDDYGDRYVTAALDGTKVSFPGPASDTDFSVADNEMRVQCTKKGTAYMNVWMYVIREFEDAIDDCKSSCIACNDDPVHAWDEGVAFYTGSLAADDPIAAGGKLIWALAEKRCKNYKTCGPNGDLDSLETTAKVDGIDVTTTHTAKVNNDLLFEFAKGRDALQAGKCADVTPITRKVVSLMTIPLIQGTMRYARYMSTGDMESDTQAEGAVFAASVLPMVHACSAADAKIIDDHTKLGQDRGTPQGKGKATKPAQFTEVKAAFERNYACLGITCADVGGLVVAANEYYPDADPCVESPPPPPPPMPSMPPASLSEIAADLPTGALVGIIVAAVVAVFAVVCVLIMVCKERSGSPIFTPLDVKPSV